MFVKAGGRERTEKERQEEVKTPERLMGVNETRKLGEKGSRAGNLEKENMFGDKFLKKERLNWKRLKMMKRGRRKEDRNKRGED